MVLSGEISRGLQMIDSFGCAPFDDASVLDQMRTKLPSPDPPTVLPELPEGWASSASADIADDFIEEL